MRKRLPNLNGLRAFEAAARHSSFTLAAEELAVTQTAISHQMRRLEDELGVQLFVRGRGGLRLSLSGERYLPAVRAAFEALREATDALTSREASGPLTVSTIASFATKWLVPHLSHFQAAHPEIDIRISTSNAMVDFRRDDVDCAIRYGHGSWPGVTAVRLMSEDIVPVCSPELLRRGPPLREPRDLARHTLLHVSTLPDDWRLWLTAAGVDDVDPERGPVFDLSIMTLQAAIEGLGVALGRTLLVDADLNAGRLVAPFDMLTPADAAYYFVCPTEHADWPRLRAFRDWLLSEAALRPLRKEANGDNSASTERLVDETGPVAE